MYCEYKIWANHYIKLVDLAENNIIIHKYYDCMCKKKNVSDLYIITTEGYQAQLKV